MRLTMKKRCAATLFSLMLFSLLGLTTFSGCGGGALVANPELSARFTPPVVPDENETLVYVIRQSYFGMSVGTLVGVDDKYVANLQFGEYCYFKLQDGFHTINLEYMGMPHAFYPLQDRPGETLFLYKKLASPVFEELQEDVGKTLVMQSKLSQQIGYQKENDMYLSLLMNPGYTELSVMKPSEQVLEPDAENATITFLRPQKYAGKISFGIWDEDKLLGALEGKTYFQVKVKAGTHHFIGKAEHFAVLKADVEAGKHYYVQVAASMGVKQQHLRLLPVKKDADPSELKKWLAGSKPIVINQSAMDASTQKRLDTALPHIKKALQDVQSGKLEARYLEPGDGR